MRNFTTSLSLAALLLSVTLAGCARTTYNPNLPVGKAAYAVIPEQIPAAPDYLIRRLDVLNVRVFREPDLSADTLVVSEAGKIELPLVGSLEASGKTVTQLSEQISARLGAQYLVNPQVTVSVKQMAPRYVSIEGEVQKPGVYEIDNNATLLSAIARAESPTRTAKLSEIVVFRTTDGQRMVARFNLKDIRTGVSPDPRIIEGDVVMVGFSRSRGLVEDILKAAPLLNVWARYTT